jgi:hypothetical protein
MKKTAFWLIVFITLANTKLLYLTKTTYEEKYTEIIELKQNAGFAAE